MAFPMASNFPSEPDISTAEDLDKDSFIILYTDKETGSIREEEVCNSNENDVMEPLNGNSGVEKLFADLSLEKFLEILEQNTLLKERLVENNKILHVQCKKVSEWKEYQLQAEKDKELLETLKKENCALNVMLEDLKASKDSQDLEISVLKQIVSDLSENENNFEEANKEIEKFKIVNDALTLELEQLKKDKNLQDEEMTSLQLTLAKLVQTNNGNVEKLEATKQGLEVVRVLREGEKKQLNKEIEDLKFELAIANEKPTLDQLKQLKEQLNTANVTLMQLEQDKFIGDGQIVKLNMEILNLRDKLLHSLLQTDQIHALKTQLDVFKRDFEMEKESKRTLKIENKRLRDEVEDLRLCCQQLQEEINEAREARIIPPPSVNEEKFRCPVCDFGFSSQINIMDFQSHIDKCLQASTFMQNTFNM